MSLLVPSVPGDFSPRLGVSALSPRSPLPSHTPLPQPSLLTSYTQAHPLSPSRPRVTLPHLSYPHLLASILSHSDASTLLAFRVTSSYFKTWIDGALARHLVFGRRSAPTAAIRGSLAVTAPTGAGESVGLGFFKVCAPPERDRNSCATIRVLARPSLATALESVGSGELGESGALGQLGEEERPRQRRRSSAASSMPEVAGEDERVCASDAWRGRKRTQHRRRVPVDGQAYARQTVSRCEVLDLVGGVPCSGLLPLLSSLSSVHTVRLRADPRQYPYSEIGARRRVTFSRPLGSTSGGLFAPVVLVEDCLRGTEHQVLTVQYDPRHPHLPRMGVQAFNLGPRLRTLTVIFRPTREPVSGTVYKHTRAPGMFKQLVPSILACIDQDVEMRIVGLEDMPNAVFGLASEHTGGPEENTREAAFRLAIAEGWAQNHTEVAWDDALAIGHELALRVRLLGAEAYRAEIGEVEWAIEAEEESPALAPRF